jgi:hypothetical protein
MDNPIWVEILTKLATPLIAAISAFYVFLQYRRAQRWKSADLAADLLEKLDTEPALSLACHALDWGVGPLLIPEQYRPLFPRDTLGEHPAVMQHDPEVLALALHPQLNERTLRDPRGLVYRFCFIKLFDHLNNTSRLLKDGQLRREDITNLKYWLEKLHDYTYAPAETPGREVFQPALESWGYRDVIMLAREFDVEPWTSSEGG